ncbi:MAG: sulfatase [Opitutaceae bacterium]|nr:sulfatase [Opitutaceae bacterium]
MSLIATLLISAADMVAADRPNVLFIVADDLGTQIGAYGNREVLTPNIDRLAARGMVFDRAYCQQAICNASRASFLTGLRPDTTRVYNLTTHFRERVPDVVTLPQQFKNHGYHSEGIGKVFHAAFGPGLIDAPSDANRMDDPPSWSVPAWRPKPRYYYTDAGIAEARRVYAATQKKTGAQVDDYLNTIVRGFLAESPDLPDNVLADGEIADRAIRSLYDFKERQKFGVGNSQPFFLAVGFLKPHTPLIAPKKYWELYDPSKLTLPENNFPPKDAPPIALQVSWNEFRAFSDVPKDGVIPVELRRRFVHGYYACISFIDAQVGRILAELDRLGLSGNTIVVLLGDHGYHLGEHSLWAKLTNFEGSARAPLVVSAPGMKSRGKHTNALVEFVDMYPSLCELTGLPRPKNLEGSSFAPLLSDPDLPWKSAAFTQYWRQKLEKPHNVVPLAIPNPPGYDRYPENGLMGYSMRTDRYRFTIWCPFDAMEKIVTTELYDHEFDPAENENIAARPENAKIVRELTAKLRKGWRDARPPRS